METNELHIPNKNLTFWPPQNCWVSIMFPLFPRGYFLVPAIKRWDWTPQSETFFFCSIHPETNIHRPLKINGFEDELPFSEAIFRCQGHVEIPRSKSSKSYVQKAKMEALKAWLKRKRLEKWCWSWAKRLAPWHWAKRWEPGQVFCIKLRRGPKGNKLFLQRYPFCIREDDFCLLVKVEKNEG